MSKLIKSERQKLLYEKLDQNPFLNDEELAEEFDVSIATIRLDRLELAIPELRVRIKNKAEEKISAHEILGELIDCERNKSAISFLVITKDMVDHAKIAFSQFLYAQADTLAHAVLSSPFMITAVANIKYKQPVTIGDKLIAKAEVIRKRDNKSFVWVKIKKKEKEIFRAKFIIEMLG